MKKLVLISTAMLTIAFTSCKKDWTCECKDDSTGEILTESPISNSRQPEAKLACEGLNAYGAGVTCKLK